MLRCGLLWYAGMDAVFGRVSSLWTDGSPFPASWLAGCRGGFLLVGWFAAGGGLFGSFADWSVCRGAVRTFAPEDTCPPSQPVVTAAGRLWCISGGCYVIK